jgi:hypothetical protein
MTALLGLAPVRSTRAIASHRRGIQFPVIANENVTLIATDCACPPIPAPARARAERRSPRVSRVRPVRLLDKQS